MKFYLAIKGQERRTNMVQEWQEHNYLQIECTEKTKGHIPIGKATTVFHVEVFVINQVPTKEKRPRARNSYPLQILRS